VTIISRKTSAFAISATLAFAATGLAVGPASALLTANALAAKAMNMNAAITGLSPGGANGLRVIGIELPR
jgi:hypothetical protein